ncbi:helicase HerA-like domain-containing protein [Raineyella sp.]|uniref:Helicase HerA-like C-terminal domain-containing protein n=1 Tax=bioreactor metagenome TaxID=1076179 RepID=A0A644YE75_9ZZZZ|nr:helicase HerA-like domain-containing protein [Raineyella sp.]MEA5153434.1 helicase HerA-like domain-containing protein [Raineyella sp.]
MSDATEAIRKGYTFDSDAIELGVLVDGGTPLPDVKIRLALSMLNRHGLVAGATGTGKTKTLQLIAEQISAAGVPVFAADIKGDLSGLGAPGVANEKLLARTTAIGQDFVPAACPVEFYALGGQGQGVPLRATVSSFGPLLLSKVLGLNATQESSLTLVFHYADTNGLLLLDLKDLNELLKFLVSDDGKPELADLGGLAKATVGVIQRQLSALSAQGGDTFFGEPEFETEDLLRTAPDGRGVISLLELPDLAQRPALFSTFLMWLLADLYQHLPEAGDLDRPKLVFFFDEAHLLFEDASKAFQDAIEQTVRLIRSKGVGVFFVTQSPKDVPEDVLAQLGSRIQHQLRAHTPNDAKALKAAVATYPKTDYDLAERLQQLGIGEAIVTVLNPDGAPTPVARTRMRAPRASMQPLEADAMTAAVAGSPLQARYGAAIDRESAYEVLNAKLQAGAEAAAAEQAAAARAKADAEAAKAQTEQARAEAQRARAEAARVKAEEAAQREAERAAREQDRAREAERAGEQERTERSRPVRREKSLIEQISENSLVRQVARSAAREITRSLFGTGRRR